VAGMKVSEGEKESTNQTEERKKRCIYVKQQMEAGAVLWRFTTDSGERVSSLKQHLTRAPEDREEG